MKKKKFFFTFVTTFLNFRSMESKEDLIKLLSAVEVEIVVDKKKKAECWKSFGFLKKDKTIIKGFVACINCKEIYAYDAATTGNYINYAIYLQKMILFV